MEKQEKKFSWENILIGILSICLGIYSIFNPDTTLSSIVILCGVFAIVYGIVNGIISYRKRKFEGSGYVFEIFISIVEIILGIYILFNINIGILTLPIIFSIWFLIDTVKDLIFTRALKYLNKSIYNFMIVINILRLISAILLIYNPLASIILAVYLVGSYFILTGVKLFLLAFYSK